MLDSMESIRRKISCPEFNYFLGNILNIFLLSISMMVFKGLRHSIFEKIIKELFYSFRTF